MLGQPGGQVSVYGKNFNVANFSDTMIDVKLCIMIVLIKLYPFVPLTVTVIGFQGHSSVKQL